MLEVDRAEFAKFLPAYIGRNAETETMRRWWYALKPFDLNHIKTAFVQRDQEKGGYPEPIQIVERCRALAGPRADTGPVEDRFWGRTDLVCACNFANPKLEWRTAGLTWQERVERSYDTGMLETCERVLARFPDLAPADAARRHLDDHPTWRQARSVGVPL